MSRIERLAGSSLISIGHREAWAQADNDHERMTVHHMSEISVLEAALERLAYETQNLADESAALRNRIVLLEGER